MDVFKKHPQWNDVKKICIKIKEHGFNAWLAGGCVRDALLGISPKDFDIVTNARPKKIESFFNKTVDVGKAFGVIRVIQPTGDFEVATFRKDGQYSDGRRPDTVELATPLEDAKRRDFTINALFYDIFEDEVYDYVDGIKDIKSRTIRTVGNPDDRFMEDKLRILRAIRFVSQLDFHLDEGTYKAVCNYARFITTVSWERIQDEVTKLIGGIRPDLGIELLHKSGLLETITPELEYRDAAVNDFSKIVGHKDQDLLGWMLLFSMITNIEQHKAVFARFKLSGDLQDRISGGLELSTSLLIFDRHKLAEQKKIAADPMTAVAADFLKIKDQLPQSVETFLKENTKLPQRLVFSDDLLQLGFKPGKNFGKLLEEVFDAQLEGKIQSRQDALDWLKNRLKATAAP